MYQHELQNCVLNKRAISKVRGLVAGRFVHHSFDDAVSKSFRTGRLERELQIGTTLCHYMQL
jgi:hypothetical protein